MDKSGSADDFVDGVETETEGGALYARTRVSVHEDVGGPVNDRKLLGDAGVEGGAKTFDVGGMDATIEPCDPEHTDVLKDNSAPKSCVVEGSTIPGGDVGIPFSLGHAGTTANGSVSAPLIGAAISRGRCEGGDVGMGIGVESIEAASTSSKGAEETGANNVPAPTIVLNDVNVFTLALRTAGIALKTRQQTSAKGKLPTETSAGETSTSNVTGLSSSITTRSSKAKPAAVVLPRVTTAADCSADLPPNSIKTRRSKALPLPVQDRPVLSAPPDVVPTLNMLNTLDIPKDAPEWLKKALTYLTDEGLGEEWTRA